MSFVLDANTVIARLNGDQRVSDRLRKLTTEDVVLCAPVLAELEFGAWHSQRKKQNLGRLHELARGMRFEPFGFDAARRFGKLKAELRRRGATKTDFDLVIAAITLDLDAVLVSDDHTFFDGAIEDLKAENWLQTTDQ